MTSLLCQIPGKHVLIAYTKGMGRGSRTARGVLLGANDLVRAKEEKPFHSGHVYSEQRLAKSLSGTELFIAAEGNVGEPKNRCVDFSGTHEFVLRTPEFLPGVTGEKRSMIDDWDMDFLDDIHKKSEPPVVDIPVDMELGASKDKTVITVPGEPGIRLEADTDMIVCAEERMTAYNPGDRLEWIIKSNHPEMTREYYLEALEYPSSEELWWVHLYNRDRNRTEAAIYLVEASDG